VEIGLQGHGQGAGRALTDMDNGTWHASVMCEGCDWGRDFVGLLIISGSRLPNLGELRKGVGYLVSVGLLMEQLYRALW